MKRVAVPIVLVYLTIVSCTETVPDLQGHLVGYIRSLDEFAMFNNDEEGFRVTVRGRSFYTTYTDESGRFEFRDLPSGTYELAIYKEGYGMMKDYSIQHLGGSPTILHASPDRIEKYFLYRVPETRIREIALTNNIISAKFDFKQPMPDRMRIQIHYSDIQFFNGVDIKRTELRGLDRNGDIYSGTTDLSLFPFKNGQKIYMRACILNSSNAGLSYYYDPVAGRNVYPNLGEESEEVSFIFNE